MKESLNDSELGELADRISDVGLTAPELTGSDQAGEVAHQIIKGLLSKFPVAGDFVASILGLVVKSPLERRNSEWQRRVGEGLAKLYSQRGVDIDSLKENDIFIDTVMQASRIAIANSQKEKLDALRSAVLNAALPNHPEETLQQIFLGFVDRFGVWHLRLLKMLQDESAMASLDDYVRRENTS